MCQNPMFWRVAALGSLRPLRRQMRHLTTTTTATTTTAATTATTTTRSRHRNGSQVFLGLGPRKSRSHRQSRTWRGLGGGGGEIGPFFEKTILLLLVYVCKNGFGVGFGHVGVQKTDILVAKNGFEKMKFFGCRSVLTRFTNVA